ncbi:MAG TPA: DUF4352 domain-containing protein [Actinoplanes sp.]|nr:DUF4352 domain-containing protein [Actinoplanes sp.]
MTYVQNPVPSKKRKWPWIAGGAVALTLIGCIGAIGSGDDSGSIGAAASTAADAAAEAGAAPAKTTAKPATEKAADKTPGIGDAVRDGKFQFTVGKVKCGVGKVGSSYLNTKAQGQFCLIDVTVENIGKQAQAFLDSVQKAYDAKEVEYSVDSSAAIYANDDQQVLFEEINPGNSVKGRLVFDIPKGTELTALELHDSMFSGGVTVSLR